MKEKVLFVSAIIGTFSATIILLINQALVIFGVDTSGYVDIINIVGMGLAAIILIVAVFFLNKYSVIQQKVATAQNTAVNTALDTNAGLMNTLLPSLANKIMQAAEDRGQALLRSTTEHTQALLRSTEGSIHKMMDEMLPALAEQTMQLVTQQSRDIVEQTTAKANATMKTMNELIPTYAKNISDSVAQTVRENNAHYHKMLVEIKALVNNLPVPNLPATNAYPTQVNSIQPSLADLTTTMLANFEKLEQLVLTKLLPIEPEISDAQNEPEISDAQNEPEISDAQNDETSQESNENSTE